MRNRRAAAAMLTAATLLAGAGAAQADCEADMLQLEAAMKAPDQTPAVRAAYGEAAERAATAMRKDDDDTCHEIIGDALARAGKTLK